MSDESQGKAKIEGGSGEVEQKTQIIPEPQVQVKTQMCDIFGGATVCLVTRCSVVR